MYIAKYEKEEEIGKKIEKYIFLSHYYNKIK
jgi:hypothetical protein